MEIPCSSQHWLSILRFLSFVDEHWIVKLFELSIFVFTATFLTNRERPYASRYASASVVSILYGNFDKAVDAADYAGMRVMLIFTGVVLFLFVELLVFPRSSRTVVQASSLQFFEDLEHFFYESGRVCGKSHLLPELRMERKIDYTCRG